MAAEAWPFVLRHSVHQAARDVLPSARVAYIGSDPTVLSHARALLATSSATV
jgi:S-adenosyl methyltransferase